MIYMQKIQIFPDSLHMDSLKNVLNEPDIDHVYMILAQSVDGKFQLYIIRITKDISQDVKGCMIGYDDLFSRPSRHTPLNDYGHKLHRILTTNMYDANFPTYEISKPIKLEKLKSFMLDTSIQFHIHTSGIILKYNKNNKHVLFNNYIKAIMYIVKQCIREGRYSHAIERISELSTRTPDDIVKIRTPDENGMVDYIEYVNTNKHEYKETLKCLRRKG